MFQRPGLSQTIVIALLMASMSSTATLATGTRIKLNPAESAEFATAARSFLSMSDLEIVSFLEARKAKGESYFQAPQQSHINLWATLDRNDDNFNNQLGQIQKVEGTSTDKSYKTFGPGSKEIIVAVLDTGGDINHEDLQGKIWTNAGEIPDNGIDDDHNGYIDDVHGWNFLGGKKDGQNVNVIHSTLEVAREFARLSKLEDAGQLDANDPYWLSIQKVFQQKSREIGSQLPMFRTLENAVKILESAGLPSDTILTVEVINAIASTETDVVQAKAVILRVVQANPTKQLSAAIIHKAYADAIAGAPVNVSTTFSSSSIVGDDETKLQPVCATAFEFEKSDCLEVGYGNNDVTGADQDDNGSLDKSKHGTHVSGIIAAIRDNNRGAIGQAQNVKIMHVRMVPDADERDKDIANAIRYAVDNGAKVLNMSFGKPYSPHKDWIDAAVKYAESKGVLLVHAAGNDATNTEESNRDKPSRFGNYPNKHVYDVSGNLVSEAANWIEVGASTKTKGSGLPAYFTNFGKTSVDLFAPGTEIGSTVPNNKYRDLQGTSMASPEVAGVAAYLMSLYPNVALPQIKHAMLATTTKYPGLEVGNPATGEKIAFADLSVTGGIVNTYTAASALAGKGTNTIVKNTVKKPAATKKAPVKTATKKTAIKRVAVTN